MKLVFSKGSEDMDAHPGRSKTENSVGGRNPL